MGKTTKTTKKVSLKKKFQQQIIDSLASSLSGLKELLGEKKFDNRVKKAAKLLSEGIKEKAPKKIKQEKTKVTKLNTEPSEQPTEK